jgi:phosphatidylserine/phosphatidylglycerophosphate/cardiolipin synthase-like enzyme
MFTELAVEGVDVRIQGPTFRSWLAQQRLGRNHTKLVLVDTNQLGKQRAYIGGVQPTQHNAMWHDMMVRITSDQIAGHPIDVLQSHFDSIWGSKPNQDAYASRGTYDFGGGFIMFDAPGVDEIMPLARNLIRRAEHEVIIESPYLQGRGLWRDLAESDAETSVIVPLHNHHSFGTPSERRLNWAVGHGLNVYRFAANAGMVHGRALLADRWSLVGSNAFNGITAGRLGEIALVTPHPGLASQLHDHLQRDIKKSLLHTT